MFSYFCIEFYTHRMVSVTWTFFIFMVYATVCSESTGKELVPQEDTREVILQDTDYGKAPSKFFNVFSSLVLRLIKTKILYY